MAGRYNGAMSLWAKTPTISQTAEGITFAVNSVKPATTRLSEETLREALARRTGRTFIALPDGDTSVVAGADFHPLIETVHRAFSEHRPLILSPDDIWLTIAQGFGHHMVENAEALRSKLVNFDGKKTLIVIVTEFPDDETWPSVIELWSASVREYIPPSLHATLVCNFSTTTPAARTASEVAVLDAFQRYFDYVLICICGIPEVTLRGTVEDWRSVRQRIEGLVGYDLDHWVARLRPILDQFVKSAGGNPETAFWRAIYKPASAYGGEVATGWITDLFPYLGNPGERYSNNTLNTPRDGWALPQDGGRFSGYGIAPASFPSGLSCAPFTVKGNGPDQRCDLLAGFLGVTQTIDGRLAPYIGWSVVEGDPIDHFWDTVAARFPARHTSENSNSHHFDGIPAELVGFYRRFEEVTLFPGTPNEWRIGPSPRDLSPTVFAVGATGLLLAYELRSRAGNRDGWNQTILLSISPAGFEETPPNQMYRMQKIEIVRKLSGNLFEVLTRLIEAGGDVERV
jgi:hypothetical protein